MLSSSPHRADRRDGEANPFDVGADPVARYFAVVQDCTAAASCGHGQIGVNMNLKNVVMTGFCGRVRDALVASTNQSAERE